MLSLLQPEFWHISATPRKGFLMALNSGSHQVYFTMGIYSQGHLMNSVGEFLESSQALISGTLILPEKFHLLLTEVFAQNGQFDYYLDFSDY